MAKKKICFVVAVAGTAQSFLRDHIKALREDYDVYLAGNIKDVKETETLDLTGWEQIDIERPISLSKDLKAVRQLSSYFKKMKFDAVHSVTPKAGLVCALAGFMVRVPIRIHIFTGQVWATRKGAMRCMLKSLDWLIAKLNTHILVDGHSQKNFLIQQGVVSNTKAHVLGDGSISGVNMVRFSPSVDTRMVARKELGINSDKVVFVFMGRLNHDKGLHELLPAFNRLVETYENAFLLIFGMDEENVAATFGQYDKLTKENFLYYGATREPQRMLQAGDVFVLPTYREGFGSSVIEAACLGLPTITSDAYGVLDASVPGETGLQCNVGDVESLYACMKELADNAEMRKALGEAGRKRVQEKFAGAVVVKHWKEYYDKLLSYV
jgi:glycosyltransferase involved in cell wall biosynthesis